MIYLSNPLIFLFHHTDPTEIYTLSLHDALPICRSGPREAAEDLAGDVRGRQKAAAGRGQLRRGPGQRSEEHTSELQSRFDLVCRLLLEKKKKKERKR